ncbi:MAG: putative transporter ATP-binding protein [Actinomycetia bacterium]|nr:putative transporter ATP-binding protein [Actinomycetes bacterium]
MNSLADGLEIAPTIVLRNVQRIFAGPPPVTALKGADLTVRRGEYVAVVGPSGSGKSTLLNLLGLLDRPTAGVYELDGVDVASIGEAERTAVRGQKIGFVFQAFHLLPYRSATENVMLAQMYGPYRRDRRFQQARIALAQVGLAHRSDAFPTTMSGGERQRVAIARALVNAPSLLLCDEPTGNLDTETAATILELLRRLHGEGQTVIIITHDNGVAAQAQRTVTIRDGLLQSAPRQSIAK